ncbi:uncharacterized protein LOC125944381 [Dermacentor silvarum]|uniref:uncharacterized protein LOC125944381 n=1 Tax=Dermacentor silvarum TaxID=543639 RepID=UPI0021010241|nr:uncharacterized protein LOC125944381 [Dermacentor silvarum]
MRAFFRDPLSGYLRGLLAAAAGGRNKIGFNATPYGAFAFVHHQQDRHIQIPQSAHGGQPKKRRTLCTRSRPAGGTRPASATTHELPNQLPASEQDPGFCSPVRGSPRTPGAWTGSASPGRQRAALEGSAAPRKETTTWVSKGSRHSNLPNEEAMNKPRLAVCAVLWISISVSAGAVDPLTQTVSPGERRISSCDQDVLFQFANECEKVFNDVITASPENDYRQVQGSPEECLLF